MKTYVGHVTGYRAWTFVEPGFLKSVSADFVWPPGPEGRYFDYMNREINLADDIRGCFAFYDYNRLDHDFGMTGKIAGWGRVIKYERGFRAQFAYPLVLYYHHENLKLRAEQAAHIYGCKIEFREMPLSMFADENIILQQSARGHGTWFIQNLLGGPYGSQQLASGMYTGTQQLGGLQGAAVQNLLTPNPPYTFYTPPKTANYTPPKTAKRIDLSSIRMNAQFVDASNPFLYVSGTTVSKEEAKKKPWYQRLLRLLPAAFIAMAMA